MKKLIIAAFAMAFATMAHAATVSWSASNIAQSTSGSTSYYAMLIDASTTTLTTADAVAKAIAGGTFDGTVMWEGAAVWAAAKKVVNVVASKKTLPESYTSNMDVNYMTIVFDAATASAAQYYLATSGDSAVVGPITAAGALTIAQGDQTGKGTWTEVVPEPTSGLLILLGMGALALRRKQA